MSPNIVFRKVNVAMINDTAHQTSEEKGIEETAK